MHNRLNTLYKSLEEKNIPALLILNKHNIYYLTGFKSLYPQQRESALLVLKDSAHFMLSPLYQYTENKKSTQHTHSLSPGENHYQKVLRILKEKSLYQLFFENDNLRVVEYNYLLKQNPQLELFPTRNIVEDLRIIKNADEIQKINKACKITDKILHKILRESLSGKTEKETAFEIEIEAQKNGADTTSFEPIIALNEHAGIPHHTPSKKTLLDSGVVLIDCGVEYQGYMSDITRMLLLKNANNNLNNTATRTFKKIYEQLKEVQMECIDEIKIGMTGEHAHAICVNKLKQYELDCYFNHALGHGVGLEIHEDPRLSPKSTHILQENMIFTIEPGVYFPHKFGIRLEDTVLLTKQGCKTLTNFTKALLTV